MIFKKIWLSVVAVLCSLNLAVGLVVHSADDESWVDIIEDTIFSFLLQGSGVPVDGDTANEIHKGLSGLEKSIYGEMLEYMITKNPLIQSDSQGNNKLSFTIPNYDLVTGKYMLHWVLADGSEDDVLVECTVILTDSPDALINLPPVKVPDYGDVYYYANALNFTITHSDGSLNRYIVSYPTTLNYSSPNFTNNAYTISAQNGCTLWEYRGGSNLNNSRPLQTGVYCSAVRFNTSTVNSVRVDLNDIVHQNNSSYTSRPVGFYSSTGTPITASNYLTYPVDIDICRGSFLARFDKINSSGNIGLAVKCNELFKTSFATTNNPIKGNLLTTYWTTPQTQNYFYNDYIQGGSTINETNVNNYFGGALLPAFDIDPDLPLDDIIALLTDLSPDLQLAMRPTLDLATGALFDRLVDFYGNMPAIGLNWDTPLDNNYWDIEFPPIPDSGGGGSGGDITVNVDITRPLVPKVTTTYWLELDVGTQTTQTYPVALVSAAPQVFDKADEVCNTLEIMPLIGLLAVFGVAVAILFKGV